MYWLPYSSHTSHHPSQTPCLPWIYYALKNWCSIYARCSKSIPYVSVAFFPSLKQNFIAYRSSKVSSRPDCVFEIHQLCKSGFSRVYSNCCYSCSFEPEIIKIGQSSHKMYSNNIVNFQESTTILNTHTKKVWKLIVCPSYQIWFYSISDIADVIWYSRLRIMLLELFRAVLSLDCFCKQIRWRIFSKKDIIVASSGAIILHNESNDQIKVISQATRTLLPAEIGNSLTEIDALVINFAVEKFHIFIHELYSKRISDRYCLFLFLKKEFLHIPQIDFRGGEQYSQIIISR